MFLLTLRPKCSVRKTTKKDIEKMESYVRARVDADKKEKAEAYLKQNGLNMSTAIRTFVYALVEQDAAALKIPTAITVRAMQDADAGRTAKFNSIDELMTDLHADPALKSTKTVRF
jgi:DNA-damage-inducible protein J